MLTLYDLHARVKLQIELAAWNWYVSFGCRQAHRSRIVVLFNDLQEVQVHLFHFNQQLRDAFGFVFYLDLDACILIFFNSYFFRMYCKARFCGRCLTFFNSGSLVIRGFSEEFVLDQGSYTFKTLLKVQQVVRIFIRKLH